MSRVPPLTKEPPVGDGRCRRYVRITMEVMVDYNTATKIEVGDYADIHNPTNDPIVLAMSITGEYDKKCWGSWVRRLNEMRRAMGDEKADKKFRVLLADLWGEVRCGECRKPGAILNLRLRSQPGAGAPTHE